MNTPTKITVTFTFDQLTQLVVDITTRRDAERWNLQIPYESDPDKDGFVDDDGHIKGYTVRSAERALTERARFADQLELLTGVRPTEDDADVARVLDARRRLDAQEAAEAAAEKEVTP